METHDRPSIHPDIVDLVEEYRDRCLWFLKPDFVPSTVQEAEYALDLIERYGDRSAYVRAEKLRQWLSRLSRPQSCDS